MAAARTGSHESDARPATLVELLRRRAERQADQRAYVYLPDGEHEGDALTYGELDRQAREIAGRLEREQVAGQRVLICHPPGLGYVSAFFGCLYAGAVAVPAYPPDPARRRRTLPRLLAILENARAATVLIPGSMRPAVEELFSAHPEMREARILVSDGGGVQTPDFAPPAIAGEDPAFLMYTSGSTGHPKGAVISHASVLHNLYRFPGFEHRPPEAFVCWLPFFHDLGLMFGMLHPLYRAVPAILMPPLAFAQRPLRWLEAISRYRATTTGGPNFGYELCVRRGRPEERQGLDLGCWTMALNGAEPVRPETLERFAAAFEPCGFRRRAFYPSYGLAEAAATVTGAVEVTEPVIKRFDRRQLDRGKVVERRGEGPDTLTLVGCGRGIEDQELVIVDPETRLRRPAGQVGEIWVSGPSIARGFWQRPEATRELIQAPLDGDGAFLRTGDLGFLDGGELFITGRLKDLIIIRGVNHYPEDVEHSIQRAHPAIRAGCGAAFSADLDGEERLVIVQEVTPADDLDLEEVFVAIRQTLAECHELEAHAVALLHPGEILKTSSGKIRRRDTRAQWLRGELDPLAVAPRGGKSDRAPVTTVSAPASGRREETARTIREWLLTWFAARLGVEPADVDPDAPFTRHGLASLETVRLVRELEEWLGCDLPPTLGWAYPTVDSLACHLAEDEAVASAAPAVKRASAGEPVAIVGIGCRFPGADGPAAFWRLLAEGGDAVTEIPPERWDVDAFYDPDPAAPGKMSTRWGGFLDRLDGFDAQFFEISPREAVHMDPQQRLLLEVSWEALEDAGIPPHSLAGSATGVYIAKLRTDYGSILFNRYLPRIEIYTGSGNGDAILANRLSYFLDLRGPSVALDTACSGSLLATHQACQSLQRGESDLALAGGVNVILKPDGNLFFTKAGALAPDGRCKPFDHRANGIVRSEGAGIVVLKLLSRALADGDRVHAVIRGSAVNQDGRSNGIMAPNGKAQEQVLRQAYAAADLSPARVQYIEAHGTGTTVGDPIEVDALAAVLDAGRPAGRRWQLGSLKSNVGHMESAAGVGGLIKAALAIRNRQIPPSLNFDRPNPLIPFDEIEGQVQQTLGPWPDDSEALIAGVSGFGFGGTNAHVVLAESPPTPARDHRGATAPYLVPLSARSPEALRDLARAYAADLDGEGAGAAVSLGDVAYTAGVRRSHLEHRLAVVAADRRQLSERLEGFLADQPVAGLTRGSKPVGREPGVVFLFSGQGSQWHGMARRLLEREEMFRATMEACDRLLSRHAGFSLLAEFAAPEEESRLKQTDVMQPAVFAMQVSLAALWLSWGVRPDAVVGQSLGEVAAAHMAGVLSLEDAVRVVAHRSRLMKRTAGQGRTAVVALPLEQAALALTGFEDRLSVAGDVSPQTSVLSGEPAALERVLAALESRGTFCRLVRDVDIAFHSPQMDPLVDELVAALAEIRPRTASVPIVSTVTGDIVQGHELGADYWGQNLRQPFRFTKAIQTLAQAGHEIFLEVSPHPVLAGSVGQCLEASDRGASVVASMRRGEDPPETLLASLGALYAAGRSVDWRAVHRDGRCVALPSYPWQRQRFWFDQLGPASTAGIGATDQEKSHPLLGSHLETAFPAGQHFWENRLEAHSPSYLADHRVADTAVLPAAGYLEMALAAGTAALGPGALAIEEVTFKQALVLPQDVVKRLQLVLSPDGPGGAGYRVFSRPAGDPEERVPWVLHATGKVRSGQAAPAGPETTLEELRQGCPSPLSTVDHYEGMRTRGLGYGATFHPLKELWGGRNQALGRLRLPSSLETQAKAYRCHPVLLDGAFQVVAATMAAAGNAAQAGPDGEDLFLPVAIGRVSLFSAPGTRLWCHARMTSGNGNLRQADLSLFDPEGRLVAQVEDLCLRRLAGTSTRDAGLDSSLYGLEWQRSDLPGADDDEGREPGSWLVFCDAAGVGGALASILEERGETCVRVLPAADYEPSADGTEIRIDPGQAEHYRRLLREIPAVTRQPWRAVVHLWSLDQANDGVAEELIAAEDLIAAQVNGCGSLIHLLQALAQAEWDHLYHGLAHHEARPLPRLWLTTRGAQPISEDEPLPAVGQTPLWGFARTIAQEHPELWGGIADLDPARPTGEAARLLAAQILAPDGEDQVAFRQQARYVPRLVRSPRPAVGPEPLSFRRDAAYLLTGGLGGLGFEVAKWMVDKGASRLVLLQRSELPPRATWGRLAEPDNRVDAVRELEEMGASVHLAAVDVGDRQQLSRFLDDYRQCAWPPIRGLVHMAGRLDDRLLLRMDPSSLEAVLRPKIAGAWLLHQLLGKEPLDFFVLFSSVASVLGSLGQANYAAGNAFLDGLAWLRRRSGQAGLAINWGPWSAVGMAAGQELQATHEGRGMRPLAPVEGLELLDRVWHHEQPQVAAVSVDWQRFGAGLARGAAPPFLSLLATPELPVPAADGEGTERAFLEQLLGESDREKREALLRGRLQQLVAAVLRVHPSQLDPDQPFNALGADSIMLAEVRTRIQAMAGVEVSLTELFTGASVASLTVQILTQLGATSEVAEIADSRPEAIGAAVDAGPPVAAEGRV